MDLRPPTVSGDDVGDFSFQRCSSQNPNPPRSLTQASARKIAHWSNRDNHIFITACETVIADGHRNGKCFTKHGWEQVIQLFNANSGHVWTKQQLKNHWDFLCQKHKRLTELLNCTGVEYISATGTIAASNEWWERKIKENKDYKDYRDKDYREVYNYKVLFGDAFDSDKYAVTPSQMCRTGFVMFEDSAYEDLLDTHPDTKENSASSDEGDKTCRDASSMDISRPRSGDKRRTSSKTAKQKRSKIGARELSYSVNRATSASQQVAEKIDNLVGLAMSHAKTLMSELMATGRLQKKTKLYFWTCKFFGKRSNREILDMQEDGNDKMDWVEWSWHDERKGRGE